MATPSNDDVLTKLQLLKAGLQANASSGSTIIASQSYTGAQLATRVQVSIAAEQKVQAARAALHDALTSCRGVRESEKEFLQGLRTIIVHRHTNAQSVLAQYGLTPPKANPKRTGEQRVLMMVKNRATRVERGTKSRRQKAAIKGNVTGVKIVPVVAPKANGDDQEG